MSGEFSPGCSFQKKFRYFQVSHRRGVVQVVKFFGLMVAVACLVSSANAALLSSYTFSDTSDRSPAEVAFGALGGPSDGSFAPNGTVGVATMGISGATLTRSENFYITAESATPFDLLIRSFTFDASKISGTRDVTWAASFNLGTPVGNGVFDGNNGFQAGSAITIPTPTISGNSYTYTLSTPIIVPSDKILRVTITATGTTAGGTSTILNLDNVQFDGLVLPEPSSIAVFGVLGAVSVIRRIRRKS
jgi:hypothetical protein